jgi:PIN domain nuclease of toxin-antitoxin system
VTTVLDTNALLRWTHAPERLSEPAQRALAQARDEPVVLCAMSLWEIAWKQRMGKLDLAMSAAEYAKRLERLPLRIVAVDVDLWLANVALDWAHRDPVDRTIVALASGLGATLVTSDREIRAFYDGALW